MISQILAGEGSAGIFRDAAVTPVMASRKISVTIARMKRSPPGDTTRKSGPNGVSRECEALSSPLNTGTTCLGLPRVSWHRVRCRERRVRRRDLRAATGDGHLGQRWRAPEPAQRAEGGWHDPSLPVPPCDGGGHPMVRCATRRRISSSAVPGAVQPDTSREAAGAQPTSVSRVGDRFHELTARWVCPPGARSRAGPGGEPTGRSGGGRC